jgi:hypothetical protein
MRACQKVIAENVTARRTRLSTEEWQSERGRYPFHATVGHGGREWAWDEDRDGQREFPGHTCEGAGAALRTDLRAFRGVHKQYRHLDIAA